MYTKRSLVILCVLAFFHIFTRHSIVNLKSPSYLNTHPISSSLHFLILFYVDVRHFSISHRIYTTVLGYSSFSYHQADISRSKMPAFLIKRSFNSINCFFLFFTFFARTRDIYTPKYINVSVFWLWCKYHSYRIQKNVVFFSVDFHTLFINRLFFNSS